MCTSECVCVYVYVQQELPISHIRLSVAAESIGVTDVFPQGTTRTLEVCICLMGRYHLLGQPCVCVCLCMCTWYVYVCVNDVCVVCVYLCMHVRICECMCVCVHMFSFFVFIFFFFYVYFCVSVLLLNSGSHHEKYAESKNLIFDKRKLHVTPH